MITKKQAIKDSLIKWKYLKESGASSAFSFLLLNHHHIATYKYHCGLCEYSISRQDHPFIDSFCNECPLFKDNRSQCIISDSTYHKWSNATTKKTRIKYATLMYEEIESL